MKRTTDVLFVIMVLGIARMAWLDFRLSPDGLPIFGWLLNAGLLAAATYMWLNVRRDADADI